MIAEWWYEEAKFCGCANPSSVLALILDALQRHSPGGDEFDGGPDPDWVQANPLMAYSLDFWELTEHGGSIYGAWLTEKGVALRDALAGADLRTVLLDYRGRCDP